MASLGDCGGTLLARRRDERVARQPEQVRRALGELDEDPGFFQLRALGRSRAYPEPGETFRLEPPCCPPLEGVVVNSHVDPMEEDAIVVLVFAPGVSPAAALPMGVPPESLMIGPQMLTDLYWRRGYLESTGHVEVDRRAIGYGFYVIDPLCREDRFEDEWGRPLPAEPRLLGGRGLATDVGVAWEVAREAIIRGLCPWPPPGWALPPPPPAATSEGRRALLDAQHPDALALAARAEGVDPACLLNGYAWGAMLPELLSRAGRPDLLRGLSADPEAGALVLSYRGRGASSRAAELVSLLNALVASGEEVLALVRSGKVDWDG